MSKKITLIVFDNSFPTISLKLLQCLKHGGSFFFQAFNRNKFSKRKKDWKIYSIWSFNTKSYIFSTRSNNRRPIRCVATRSALVILIICFEFPKENTGFSNSENGWRAVSKRVPPIARITLKDREFNCTHMRNVQITWIMIFLLFMQIPCSGWT